MHDDLRIEDVRVTLLRLPYVEQPALAAGYAREREVLVVEVTTRGGLTGRGADEASQTTGFYLPEHATDFVFSSLAEQRGFLGAGLLLLLYGLLIWRGARIVARSVRRVRVEREPA